MRIEVKPALEKWKTLDEYPNYQVSDTGKVKNIRTNKELKPFINSLGYLQVDLRDVNGKRKEMLVHRLVALSFLPNPKNLPVINHIDEDPRNNMLGNLEWMTQKDNCNHGTRNKRISETKKKEVIVKDAQGNVVDRINGIIDCALKYKISTYFIRLSRNGTDLIKKKLSKFNFSSEKWKA